MDNLVLIIDNSFSMDQSISNNGGLTRLELVKRQLDDLLQTNNIYESVSVFTFEHTADLLGSYCLMRRYGFCEERGSGWDKIGLQCELYQLPAPRIDNYDDSIRVVLFGHVEFKAMDASERLRACYLHACLQYIKNDHLTNASLRYRFGLEKSNSATISRIINDSVEKGLIKLVDDTVGNKARQYEPYWA
ncbi:MAG: hypothetical protein PHO29_08125 [Acetobacterium sp.]|nr:hypothetical protein [Acetobacterium sp.]